jgi:hypothetical protein
VRQVWLVGDVGGVDSDPAPSGSAAERAAEDPVDLADAGVGESAAPVGAAPTVAGVGPVGAVLGVPPAGAVITTPAKGGVEGLQDLGVQASDLQVPELRSDVLLDLADVPAPGRRLNVEDFQLPVEQLVDRGASSWAAPFVDLAEQPGPDALGFLPRARPRRDRLGEVVPSS